MADQRILQLTTLLGANVSETADYIPIVDASASQTKKINRSQLFSSVAAMSMSANNPALDMTDTDSGNVSSVVLDNTSLRFDVNGQANALRINENGLILSTVSVPASATAAGVAGQVAYDANFVYICTATNTWKRSALSTW